MTGSARIWPSGRQILRTIDIVKPRNFRIKEGAHRKPPPLPCLAEQGL